MVFQVLVVIVSPVFLGSQTLPYYALSHIQNFCEEPVRDKRTAIHDEIEGTEPYPLHLIYCLLFLVNSHCNRIVNKQ